MNPRIFVPVLGVIAFSLLMAMTGAFVAPHDVWPNVLLSGCFLAGIGLAGAFVVAVHDASSGHWLGPLRRIACSLTRLVLPGSAIALAAIVFGGSHLYPAWHEHLPHGGLKAIWLDRTFFTIRAFAWVAAWLISIRWLRHRRGAPAFLVVFGLTVWLSSFDWLMALDPHWASTIFGVYRFAGLVTAGLAVIAIVAVARSRTDASITSDHLHDIGKLLFAFSTFWMYIWFSQGMLIWYTNMPEETSFYAVRAYGNWGVLFWAVVGLMWIVPFFVLLSEPAKRNRTILMRVAIAVLIGHWLDLYVTIVPASSPEPHLNGWELAIAFGTFAAVGWAVTRPSADALPAVLEPAAEVSLPS
ncbi:MAG TPA: hypothetical protein VNL91_05775 [Thermoanaerobaculia bacterium]|nr:hypothetical protein [Thermoanaerobaculia bacterium]